MHLSVCCRKPRHHMTSVCQSVRLLLGYTDPAVTSSGGGATLMSDRGTTKKSIIDKYNLMSHQVRTTETLEEQTLPESRHTHTHTLTYTHNLTQTHTHTYTHNLTQTHTLTHTLIKCGWQLFSLTWHHMQRSAINQPITCCSRLPPINQSAAWLKPYDETETEGRARARAHTHTLCLQHCVFVDVNKGHWIECDRNRFDVTLTCE